ncbi:MAG: translation initiation factor IF-2 [Bdellovibrionota bacterium]
MSEQQQESLKVYELAKELGLDSFTLLDKLKSINIEVKSHMSSLAADQAQAIRDALKKDKKPAAAAVKKRASAAPAAAKADAPAGATAAPTAAKKTAKKAAADSESPKAAKAESTKAGAAPARKVIKRRTGAEGEAGETAAPAAQPTHESEAEQVSEAAPVYAQPEETAPEFATEQSPEAAPMEAPAAEETAQFAEPSPEQPAAQAAAPSAPQAVQPRKPVEEFHRPANAPGTKVIFRTPGAAPVRTVEKDEMSGEFGSRRLKIVQAAPPPSALPRPGGPTYRTPGAPTGDRPVGPRHRTGTGTMGTPNEGPAPSRPGEMFQPMTSYASKEEEAKSKGRGGNTTRGPTPEEVRINDFRKRELVFQPKRKKLPPGKQVKRTEITEMAAHKKKIRMEDKIVVSDLAQRMGEKNTKIMSKLIALGSTANLNQTVDFDTAQLIAQEFGWEVENIGFSESSVIESGAADAEHMESRPPIITVMGHVDHGKTSLLDAIRKADVASGEAGGITQHIGAYSVMVDGKPITFLDTPGHEAFLSMRARGANLTDIVVLVVAADDSIMPQTKEAIKHALTAGVPIIVAANKMDKPAANIEKVKKDLSVENVLVEEWGGEVPLVPVSATKKTGIQDLLETIKVQAEVLELKANPNRAAEGVILEARMEKGRGIVADLLVDKGTLRTGDHLVVGTAYGRVRAMTNDRGQSITEVKPGFPAEVLGLNDVPGAGDTFNVVADEAAARELSNSRRLKAQAEKAAKDAPKTMTIEELMAKMPTPGVKELNVLVKADVYGSAEAIKESIEKIVSEKVKAKVISSGVGVITENDVLMAKTSGGIILGFNSKPDNKARDIAKREKVDIRHYTIIYQLLDDVKVSMEALLEPLRKETQIGKADVKQVFTVSKLGTVAGSVVADGKIVRNAFARVIRGKDTVVAEGKIVSLKRFKDDVSETIKGQECGIGVEDFEKYLPGDVINVYQVELVKQTL